MSDRPAFVTTHALHRWRERMMDDTVTREKMLLEFRSARPMVPGEPLPGPVSRWQDGCGYYQARCGAVFVTKPEEGGVLSIVTVLTPDMKTSYCGPSPGRPLWTK